MASGEATVGEAVGARLGVGASGTGVAFPPPQAVKRVKASSRATSFVRTGFLQKKMRVLYLKLKIQSASRGALNTEEQVGWIFT
jgi:hypothetical protein